MPRSWTTNCATTATIALLVAGCGRTQQDARTSEHATAVEQQARTNEELTLVGCIGTASGTRDLVLQNVRHAPSSEPDGRNQSAARIVAEGSWVRLAGVDAAQLTQHSGRQVQVTGALMQESGSKGTSGDENSATPSTGPGVQTPSGDRSRAATDQHHSDKVADEAGPIARDFMPPGPAPELRVREIKETGDSCSAAPR
jgi:hypothetical protein